MALSEQFLSNNLIFKNVHNLIDLQFSEFTYLLIRELKNNSQKEKLHKFKKGL
jgi:hypothetical protein